MTQEPASSLVVDFDAGREIVLVCTTELAPQLGGLAQELLASGYEASVATGLERGPEGPLAAIAATKQPGLIVVCHSGADIDTEAFRQHAEAVCGLEHVWLDGGLDARVVGLQTRILAQLNELERADEPLFPEGFDIEEVSNVVLLPVAPPAEADREVEVFAPPPPPSLPAALLPHAATMPPPAPRRWSELVVAFGAGLACAALALAVEPFAAAGAGQRVEAVDRTSWPVAAGGSAVAPSDAMREPTLTEPEANPPEANPPEANPPEAATLPAAPSETAAAPADAPGKVLDAGQDAGDRMGAALADAPPTPPPTSHAAATSPEVAQALERGGVVQHGEVLVAVQPTDDRSWFQAMNTCRGRSFAGVSGWRVPPRAQLLALARQGVLPPQRLWSASRGDRDGTTAIAVHGRAATVSRVDKNDSKAAVVCVRGTQPRTEG